MSEMRNIACLCQIIVHLFLLNRKDMSLTSILSAEAIENAVMDCQGIIFTGLNPQDQQINARRFYRAHDCHDPNPNPIKLIILSLFFTECHFKKQQKTLKAAAAALVSNSNGLLSANVFALVQG